MARMGRMLIATTIAVMAVGAAPAAAKQWQVKMVNAGPTGMSAFVPAFLVIAPGDTVKYVAVDKGHNAEAMPTMIPAGATAFKGKTDEEIEVTFTTPGLYGIKCKPHVSMGMVGLIEVKDASNKAELTAIAEKLPPLAKKTMTGLLAQAK